MLFLDNLVATKKQKQFEQIKWAVSIISNQRKELEEQKKEIHAFEIEMAGKRKKYCLDFLNSECTKISKNIVIKPSVISIKTKMLYCPPLRTLI